MSKEFTFKLSERYSLIRVMNELKGNIELLAALFEDVKAVSITPDEWKAANLTKTPTDEQVAAMPAEERATVGQQWNWDDEVGEKAITLSLPTINAVVAFIKARSDANELSIADIALVNLQKKLSA